jgi:hypothetical protein
VLLGRGEGRSGENRDGEGLGEHRASIRMCVFVLVGGPKECGVLEGESVGGSRSSKEGGKEGSVKASGQDWFR